MLVTYIGALTASHRHDGRAVFGDATHMFVQLRSLVFDRDLDFHDEYVRIYGLDAETPETDWIYSQRTTTGHVRNYMPVGPALLWMPLYVLFALAALAAHAAGLTSSAPDGYEFALQLAPGISGVAAATAAAWLSWRMARRFAGEASAAVGLAAIWFGSHATYYSLVSPAYSHAASMLTSAVFFGTWLARRHAPGVRLFAALGALAGVSTLMRWQDVVFLLVPILDVVRWRTSWRQRIVALAATAGAWLIVFAPQMLIWRVLYGRALAVPQGPSFMRWTSPHPIDVLFSTSHGLFTWAPVLVVALAGLATFVRRTPGVGLPIGAVLAASWYVNAAVADWWAGEAYGARRFLSLFPLFVLGTATWIRRPEAGRTPLARYAVLVVLTALNALLLLQYELFMKGLSAIAPYPGGGFDMWLARFVVPFRLIAYWLRGA